MSMLWTEQEKSVFARMIEDRVPLEAIALALERPIQVLRSRCARMGIGYVRSSRRPQVTNAMISTKLKSSIPIKLDPDRPERLGSKTLIELEDAECHAVLDNDLYCAKPATDEQYCNACWVMIHPMSSKQIRAVRVFDKLSPRLACW